MKSKIILSVVLAATLAQSAQANNADAGTILGGVIGGLLGNAAGGRGGNGGRTAGTIIGVVAGAIIGNKVGQNMDENDRRAFEEAQRRSLSGDLNDNCDWDGSRYGSRTGYRGRVVTTREGYNQAGEYCREYDSVIYSRGGTEETRGVACSRGGGWYEVNSSQITWGARGPGGFGRHDGGRPGPYRPGPAPVPVRPLPPPPPVQNNVASVQVNNISRRIGGELIRVSFAQPVAVDTLEVRAFGAGMRIHDATVYLASGSQVKVREYWETPIFYSGDRAVSERLNLPEFVVAIDIRAEAMGGFANALITVNTNYGYPVLNVSRY